MELNTQVQNFFLLRTPLLPYQALLNPSVAGLKALFGQPALQEAVFLASPELYEAMQVWLRNGTENGKNREKLEVTLLKYLLRMSYRCTPFGLFAGVSVGEWGEKTGIRLSERARYQRHSRLDMDYLCALALNAAQLPAVRTSLAYYPNNTLYRVGDRMRYVEYRIHKKRRSHHLVNVDASGPLDTLLALAEAGAKPRALAEALVDGEISPEEASAFVDEAIDGQLLVSELEPFVTGEEYLSRLRKRLPSCEGSELLTRQLEETAHQFAQLDCQPPGVDISRYQEIAAGLQTLGTAFEPGQLFQVDMSKPVRQNTVSPRVTEELRRAVDLLARTASYAEVPALKRFREAFRERYEGREVALTEVLDTEMGLGYPLTDHAPHDHSPLLEEIPLGEVSEATLSYGWSAWQQFVFDKYLETVRHHRSVLELTDGEVAPFLSKSVPALPRSLYAMVSLLAGSAADVDEGNFQLVHQNTAGPSAANLLGRFCHLDPALAESVRAALREEEQGEPDVIFAEIVHINQARIGNISLRPVLRPYEIPIMVQAGVDEAHTIRLADLMVSVRDNRIVLRSKRLGREVVPRLSTAHNYALHALPQYHFLCDLQFQRTQRSLGWNWGVLNHAEFLPQVRYGKTILAKARWLLKEADLKAIADLEEPALGEKINAWRSARGIPRWVVVAEGDNDLPLDLDNSLCRRVLQSLSRSKPQLGVEECPFDETNLLVEGVEGRFTNELIIPLRYQPEAALAPPRPAESIPVERHPPLREVERSFNLGSEWLYVKLYCGVKTADAILTEIIGPVAEKLRAEGVIDQWFFIRYGDPAHHLRVRFHGNPAGPSPMFYAPVIHELENALRPYTEANLLAGLKTDTYHRELERYGFDNVVASETLFFHDSVAVATVLGMLEGDEGDGVRWQLALRGVDALLNDFGLDLAAKRKLMDRLQDGFKREFQTTHPEARKAFGNKFRKERSGVEFALRASYSPDEELAPALRVFEARSQGWRETVARIIRRCENQALTPGLDDLLSSYVHMFLNRFFRSRQRMHEAVVYDFLFQHYTSALARGNQNR